MCSFRDAFGQWTLAFCVACLCALGVSGAMYFAVSYAKRVAEWARRAGFVSAVLLAFCVVGMVREGVVTLDDKEEYRDAMSAIAAERAAMADIIASKSGELPDMGGSVAVAHMDATGAPDAASPFDGSVPNLRDAVQGLTASDYEAGFVLAEVRTGESHDFAAPTNAVWQQDWLGYGGFDDSFRLDLGGLALPFGTNAIHALTVFQRGLVRLRTSCAASFFAPLETTLGVVPESRHASLPEGRRPSGFRQCQNPLGRRPSGTRPCRKGAAPAGSGIA